MTIDEPVTIQERYARAATSSNLAPKAEERTDLDLMIASGMAMQRCSPMQLAALRVQRMIDTGDQRDLWLVVEHYTVELAEHLARKGRRQINKDGRRMLSTSVLHWMMHMTCDYCGGTGKIAMEGTAGTRAETCSACHGSGIKPLSRAVPSIHARTALWLVDEVNKHSREAIKKMRLLLKN